MLLFAPTLRNYAWGSTTAIPELAGRPSPAPQPEAELWFGTHPAEPSELSQVTSLPLLVKILAAERTLSIQAHPSLEQAQDGFAKEEAAGVPLDSPSRNYKDPNHKPELLIALTPFRAWAGFRDAALTCELFAALGCALTAEVQACLDQEVPDFQALVRRWLTLSEEEGQRAVAELLRAAEDLLAAPPRDDSAVWMREACAVLLEVAAQFPGDRGLLCGALLNLVVLQPGEAIFLQAGQLHAYIDGVGLEVMANSDNVLRGGLTEKHCDVPELLRVLSPVAQEDPRVVADDRGVYRAGNFVVRRLNAASHINGPALLVAAGADAMVEPQ